MVRMEAATARLVKKATGNRATKSQATETGRTSRPLQPVTVRLAEPLVQATQNWIERSKVSIESAASERIETLRE